MRLLVLGASGLLGSNVVAGASASEWTVRGTYHSAAPDFDVSLDELDLRDRDRIADLVERTEPDWVVNCAAATDVDACEEDPDHARSVNADAAGRVAAECEARGVGLCHVSTDYVFDGDASEPLSESAPTDPIQVYGETKLAGERAVRAGHSSPLIVRPSFLYGIHGATGSLTGFPLWVRDRLRAEERVPLFVDQFVTPSRAGQVADRILQAVRDGASGTYHVACRSCVTPYGFGEELRTRLGAPESLLEEATLADVDRPAPRPSYTCLSVGKIEAELGVEQPTLAEDLDAINSTLGA